MLVCLIIPILVGGGGGGGGLVVRSDHIVITFKKEEVCIQVATENERRCASRRGKACY